MPLITRARKMISSRVMGGGAAGGLAIGRASP